MTMAEQYAQSLQNKPTMADEYAKQQAIPTSTVDKPLQQGEQVPEGYETYHDPMQGTMVRPIEKGTTATEALVGVGEAAMALGTGATGGAVGYIGGVLSGLYDALESGTLGTKEGAQMVKKAAEDLSSQFTYAPRTEAGQEYTQKAAETLAPLEALTPMAVEAGAVTRAVKPAIQKAVSPVTKAIGEEIDLLKAAIPETEKVKQLKITMRENPTSENVAKYKIEKTTTGERIVSDMDATESIKQGFKPGVISSVKAASDADRQKMAKMLNIHKLGKKSEVFAAKNRPADVIGKSLDERLKFLATEKKNAGKELNEIANSLKGEQVDYRNSLDTLVGNLEEIGVNIEKTDDGVIKVLLKGSDIEGDTQSKKLLSNIMSRALREDADAKDLHNLKRFIDTQVSYGKRSANPISGTTERIMKEFRSNINKDIGDSFPEYKQVNTKYSDTLGALDDIQKSAGTKINLDSQNVDKALGTSLRKLLSNYGSRVNLIDAIDNANTISKKYGMKANDDIVNQVIFANEMDRMFGSPASTSFKGQIEQAVAKGTDVARRGVTESAIDMAVKGMEKAKGINEENAIKSIEKILKQKQEK